MTEKLGFSGGVARRFQNNALTPLLENFADISEGKRKGKFGKILFEAQEFLGNTLLSGIMRTELEATLNALFRQVKLIGQQFEKKLASEDGNNGLSKQKGLELLILPVQFPTLSPARARPGSGTHLLTQTHFHQNWL